MRRGDKEFRGEGDSDDRSAGKVGENLKT